MSSSRLSDASDRALAEAVARHGDERAFRVLYGRHTPRLYQFLLRMLAGSVHDAEDVVQDTWVRAVERLDGFRWESQLSTWLIGIGANLCRDRLRRRARRRALTSAELVGNGATPPRGAEERIDLERAIALLPAGYREVLLLHDVEGLTHGEIATRLGIAEGTSKSQLFFARRTMRRLLKPVREVEDARVERR
jgi:RNA polymerase sigma-70 factor, ECF subfamily